MAFLEVERVSKAFGGVHAVSDVSFSLEEGEILGVMGPNGSGKTTLFNLITGALAPDRGRIRLRGHELAGLPPHRIARLGVARTFQLVRPFAGLSALDNVLVGQLYGRDRRARSAARAEAARLLDVVGLAVRAEAPAAQLTLVERKRLGAGPGSGHLSSAAAPRRIHGRPQPRRNRRGHRADPQPPYPSHPFSPHWTFDALLMTFIGGVGTLHGPVLGAVLYVALKEYLALRWVELHLLIFGVVFIAIVLLLPGGLVQISVSLPRLVRQHRRGL